MPPKKKAEPLLGAHVSTAGGLPTAFDRADTLGINTFQLFVKNNKQWFAKEIEEEEVQAFRKRRKQWNKGPLVAHACYLLNLGTDNPDFMDKTKRSFIQELTRADKLGVDYLVFHPGSHGGRGVEAGVKSVAAMLNEIHRETPGEKTKSVLEITAGQGNAVGS